jgi:hypothetical protein
LLLKEGLGTQFNEPLKIASLDGKNAALALAMDAQSDPLCSGKELKA